MGWRGGVRDVWFKCSMLPAWARPVEPTWGQALASAKSNARQIRAASDTLARCTAQRCCTLLPGPRLGPGEKGQGIARIGRGLREGIPDLDAEVVFLKPF